MSAGSHFQSQSMSTGKRQTLDSYFVKCIRKSIQPGDCVYMRSPESSNRPYIAKVKRIEPDDKGSDVSVHVQWYYWPEETTGGRKRYHGSKELFISDHYDVQSAETIEGKCTVHSIKSYTKLEAVENDDFYCCFEYASATGEFYPNRAVVYCKCEMPYNPDDLMIQCESCKDWFHPACIGITGEEANGMEHFFCHNCLQNSHAIPAHSSMKVIN
ncbi:chromatin remodeling protein EBS-like [Bidens hawaiensis]|uniref:chromatin remodeling protein EBS-like n=1 Tax=Bidens hawaiensis TaxID=980011 RepID=UPI004049E12F